MIVDGLQKVRVGAKAEPINATMPTETKEQQPLIDNKQG